MTEPVAPSGNPAPNSPPNPAPTLVTAPADPNAIPSPNPAAKPAEPPKVEAPAAKAPEKYEFKAPEGYEIDKPLIDAVAPIFKELDLSQEQAAKVVDTYLKHQVASEAQLDAQFKTDMENTAKANLQAIRTEWGAAHDANMAIARDGMTKVLTAAAVKKLDETGLGNDPDFLKGFLKVGRMTSEDRRPPAGNPTVTTQKPIEQRLYPSMNSSAN